jgi:hypothetical protein
MGQEERATHSPPSFSWYSLSTLRRFDGFPTAELLLDIDIIERQETYVDAEQ